MLCARNDVALQLNSLVLAQIDPGTEHVALSIDSISEKESGDSTNFPVGFVNSLVPSGLPPHTLRVRVGAIVIVLRNLDKERSICNGCRCIVIKISRRPMGVLVRTGRPQGTRYVLPRIPSHSGASEFPFMPRRR